MSDKPSASVPDFQSISVLRQDLTVLPQDSMPPTCSTEMPTEGPCPVCPHLAEKFEPYRQAAFWKAMHERSKVREQIPQQEIQDLQARLRLREQQLFGRKTESKKAGDQIPDNSSQGSSKKQTN